MIRNSIARAVSSLVTRPVNGAKLSFETVMKKLFANGEQGFWYDPNDLSTMYQDAAGTIPVTAAGQAVGLLLDKRKPLGKNLITNGSFKDGTTGWTVSGNAVLTTDGVKLTGGGGDSNLSQSIDTVVGKTYMITARIVELVGSGLTNSTPTALAFNGTRIFTATATSHAINFRGYGAAGANNGGTLTDIVVREIPGSHAYQSTSASRPILQDAPRRIDFDAIDDKLITTLPAQLTGCTVIRAVPNVGAQILTGQTIPATYEDNKDHCGLIVINRALTPSETSAIATEFNKRAGV